MYRGAIDRARLRVRLASELLSGDSALRCDGARGINVAMRAINMAKSAMVYLIDVDIALVITAIDLIDGTNFTPVPSEYSHYILRDRHATVSAGPQSRIACRSITALMIEAPRKLGIIQCMLPPVEPRPNAQPWSRLPTRSRSHFGNCRSAHAFGDPSTTPITITRLRLIHLSPLISQGQASPLLTPTGLVTLQRYRAVSQ